MTFTLPNGVFSSVRLSKKHQGALIDEAETVVSETIAVNEAFLAQGAKFRDPKWHLIRSKEGIHVYRQRPTEKLKRSSRERYPAPISPDSRSTTWPSSWSFKARRSSKKRVGTDIKDTVQSFPPPVVTDNSIQEKMRRPNVSLMMLHGTVDGTLDDSMFGAVAASDQAWMRRSSHVNDRLDDARFLATIRGPTRNDPFRFLGIKWFAKEHPPVLTGILQRRDFLIMEATGLTTDSKGEKVGYFLMHSVDLRAVPELLEMNVIRGKLSFCFILRQNGPGKVEIYCRGFSDPRGEMMERVSVAIAAEALICTAGVVDYAYIKKLSWLMKRRGGNCSVPSRCESQSRSSHCELCSKSFTKFALIAVVSRTAMAGKSSSCQICRRVVCTKCSVVKKMTVNVSVTGAVKQRALRFCLSCLLEAKEKSTWEMALDGVEASTSISGPGSSAAAPMPYKANPRRDGQFYSEYQRADNRVDRQGEIATDFSRARKPENLCSASQQISKHSRKTDRSLTIPEGRMAQVEAKC